MSTFVILGARASQQRRRSKPIYNSPSTPDSVRVGPYGVHISLGVTITLSLNARMPCLKPTLRPKIGARSTCVSRCGRICTVTLHSLVRLRRKQCKKYALSCESIILRVYVVETARARRSGLKRLVGGMRATSVSIQHTCTGTGAFACIMRNAASLIYLPYAHWFSDRDDLCLLVSHGARSSGVCRMRRTRPSCPRVGSTSLIVVITDPRTLRRGRGARWRVSKE